MIIFLFNLLSIVSLILSKYPKYKLKTINPIKCFWGAHEHHREEKVGNLIQDTARGNSEENTRD